MTDDEKAAMGERAAAFIVGWPPERWDMTANELLCTFAASEIARLKPGLPVEPREGFVRVEALALVSSAQEWAVVGTRTDGMSDPDADKETIYGLLGGDGRWARITADVPLPSPPVEVEGVVKEKK